MEPWLKQAANAAGGLELSADEMKLLLELAGHAAHASGNRVNAPLLCYIVGRLQGDRPLEEVVEDVRRSTS